MRTRVDVYFYLIWLVKPWAAAGTVVPLVRIFEKGLEEMKGLEIKNKKINLRVYQPMRPFTTIICIVYYIILLLLF